MSHLVFNQPKVVASTDRRGVTKPDLRAAVNTVKLRRVSLSPAVALNNSHVCSEGSVLK